jgi:hypothetical protein
VDRWPEAAEAAEAQEDKLQGASRRGDEMSGWIADKQKRAWPKSARPESRVRRRRPQLEPRRKPKPNAQRRRDARPRTASARGRFLTRPQKSPVQRDAGNFTDPHSRVLLTNDGFIHGYNARAAVDGAKQIIVAFGLTQSMSDCPQLVPSSMPSGPTSDTSPGRFRRTRAIAVKTICWRSRPGRSKHPAETTRRSAAI